jgi:hypothetical protein
VIPTIPEGFEPVYHDVDECDGAPACNEIAFYYRIGKWGVPFTPMISRDCIKLDGNHPQAFDPIRCGHCNAPIRDHRCFNC